MGLSVLFGKVQGTSGFSPQGHDKAIKVCHPNISHQGLTRLFSLLLPELGKEARARQGVQACLQDLKSQREITDHRAGPRLPVFLGTDCLVTGCSAISDAVAHSTLEFSD